MDSSTSDTLRQHETAGLTESGMGHDAASAAYTRGYADGCSLLCAGRPACDRNEPRARIRARYLHCIQAERPTTVERAYVNGFRDAASDNLPCPPRDIEPRLQPSAA